MPTLRAGAAQDGPGHGARSGDCKDEYIIPAVAGCLSPGAHPGGCDGQAGNTPGHLVPVAMPIQDGREIDKAQNGMGVGTFDDPAYTLDQTGAQAVAFGGDVARKLNARHDSSPCADRGMDVVAVPAAFHRNASCSVTAQGDVTAALRAGAEHSNQFLMQPAVAFAQNTRDELREMEVVGALAAEPGMKQTSYLRQSMQVRRLTPTECERLQGFPDSWTADFSDSTRYKMLGNAVCVNVAEWIAKRINQ
jgi:hypothetical protein